MTDLRSQSQRPRVVRRRAGNVIYLQPRRTADGSQPAQLDDLVIRHNAALAALRTAGADMEAFNAAAREEAQLAAEIRHLKRRGTPDQYRQDIWDSFPHLKKPERISGIHPYFETQE